MYTSQNVKRTYTLEEARYIIDEEKAERREMIFRKAKQKTFGLFAIAISIVSPILLDGDATISLLMFPIGLYVLLTKGNIFEQ